MAVIREDPDRDEKDKRKSLKKPSRKSSSSKKKASKKSRSSSKKGTPSRSRSEDRSKPSRSWGRPESVRSIPVRDTGPRPQGRGVRRNAGITRRQAPREQPWGAAGSMRAGLGNRPRTPAPRPTNRQDYRQQQTQPPPGLPRGLQDSPYQIPWHGETLSPTVVRGYHDGPYGGGPDRYNPRQMQQRSQLQGMYPQMDMYPQSLPPLQQTPIRQMPPMQQAPMPQQMQDPTRGIQMPEWSQYLQRGIMPFGYGLERAMQSEPNQWMQNQGNPWSRWIDRFR